MIPVLETRGQTKTFGAQTVQDGVDLAEAPGESLVVIGQSGTGKSVLLKSILGLKTPDGGQVLWQGETLTAAPRPAFLDGFGMLFQGAALFDSLTVWQNVAFRLRGPLGDRRAREIAIEKLARLGLGAEVADLHPAALSGGMAKRAGLARAIAADPKVIFFDEPTTGLDPIRAARINALIRGIVTETGASAITITHDMTTVRSVGDRVAMLAEGRVWWQGGVADMDAATEPHLHNFIRGIWQA